MHGCSHGCSARKGACSPRVHVSATREQVERGVWCICTQGRHVPSGTAPEPPEKLKWSRLARAWAVDKSTSANVAPVVVAAQNRAEVGPNEYGKHVVRHKVLAKAKGYRVRLARGIAMTD